MIVVLDSTVGNNIATTFKEVFFPRESNQKSFLTLMTTTTENVGTSLGVNNSPIQVLFDGVGVGVGRIRKFPFSSNSASDSVANDQVKTRLSESEVEEER